MQETDQEEELLLDLNLAVVSKYSSRTGEKKRKRSRNGCLNSLKLFENYEGMVYELLKKREHMLKLESMKPAGVLGGKGLHLIHLLLITATAMDENNVESATKNLGELYQHASFVGDSVQRVAAYFADGLAAKLLTSESPFYDMIMKNPTPKEEFLAFTELYRASPYYQFAHFTANQAIIEAFEEEEENNNRTLHVIDFDISYGFQWPSLIQSLSAKATKSSPVTLCITGFGSNLEELIETEIRLVNFAKGCCNLVFEFRKVLRGSKLISPRRNKKETVAVNLVFHLHTLTESLQISETLKSVYSFNPSIVILVEQEGNRRPRSFLSRFMESLHYFAAMFDSLDDCLSLESPERLSIEKNQLGKLIKCMINNETEEDSFQRLETWKKRMENHGFGGNKLSSKSVIQAKLLLKLRSHCSLLEQQQVDGGGGGGFRVFERDEGFALSLGWQDRCLVTASTWNCVLR